MAPDRLPEHQRAQQRLTAVDTMALDIGAPRAPVQQKVMSDGTGSWGTYVPGSLRVVDGPGSGDKTDQAGDDQGEFDADKVSFTLGDDATPAAGGSLPNAASLPGGTTVEFKVKVGRDAAGRQVTNQATVGSENRLGPEPEQLTSTSGDAVTKVNPAVDLSVVKSADSTKVTVGQTVTYRVTVRNAGPNDATGVMVKDMLPSTLTFLSATASNGTYAAASGMWTVGALASGASATLTVHAKATAVAETTNTATADATELDLDPANDSDSVKICIDPEPFCPYCIKESGQKPRN